MKTPKPYALLRSGFPYQKSLGMRRLTNHPTSIGIYNSKNNKRVAVINLMGNIFMKKCDDVFEEAKKFTETVQLKNNEDFIIVD